MELPNDLKSKIDDLLVDKVNTLLQGDKVVYPLPKSSWGPTFWNYLHTISANYPNNPRQTDKVNMQSSIYHFVREIPCLDPCRESAVNYIKTNPPDLTSKPRLFKWSVDFHNFVNQKLGKPIKEVELKNDVEVENQLAVKRRALSMDQMYQKDQIPTQQGPPSEVDQRFNSTFGNRDIGNSSVEDLARNLQQQDMMMNIKPEINRDNVLSGFEPTFEFLAGPMGIRAVDLNLLITPPLLVGIVQNIATANLTLLGQFGLSSLSSLIMITAGSLAKDGMGYGDRLLIQTIGFNYLADAIAKLNNKERDTIFEQGSKLVEIITNWGKDGRDSMKELIDGILETPAMKQDREKPQLQGLEATLMEGDPFFSGALSDIRESQNQSQGLFDMSSGTPSGIGRLTSKDPLSISRAINNERNTLPHFVDNVRQISVDQSALNDIPVPTYIMPNKRY